MSGTWGSNGPGEEKFSSEAMPHGGFGGTSPEDRELATELRLFLEKHRR